MQGGGLPEYGGSNIPLRGAKQNFYEGGIRAPTFIYNPMRILSGIVETGYKLRQKTS